MNIQTLEPVTVTEIIDHIPDKLDTMFAAGTAAVLGWQNYRLRNAQTRSAEIDPIAQQVNIIHSIGEDLRKDVKRLRDQLDRTEEQLDDCEKHKAEMVKRVDAQDLKLSDLANHLANSMNEKGVPKKVTIRKDLL